MSTALKRLMKVFHNLDIYGCPVSLTVERQKLYHTGFGTIVSIGILTLTIASFLLMLISMFRYDDPSVIS
jgi:hypothetical protein